MKITLEGREYTVTNETIAEVVGAVQAFAMQHYSALPETVKLACTAGARALLMFSERKEPDKEKRLLLRPPKGTDPVQHLLSMMLHYIKGALPHVSVRFVTTEDGHITDLDIIDTSKDPGTHGGSVLADRDIGQRQDNGGEVVGSAFGKALSNS